MPRSSRTVTCGSARGAVCRGQLRPAAARERDGCRNDEPAGPCAPAGRWTRKVRGMATRPFRLRSEGDDAFEHEPLKRPPFLMLVGGIAEVLLVDVLHLGQQARRDEPAAADLPALRADVAGDAGQRALAPCCSGRRRTACRSAGTGRPRRPRTGSRCGRSPRWTPCPSARSMTPKSSSPRNFTNGFTCIAVTLFLKPGLMRPDVQLRRSRSPRCSRAPSSSASRRGRRRRACCSSTCRS